MMNVFGLKLIYPGSTRWLLQPLIAPALAENRASLVVKRGGERYKLATEDGNHIDAMFFDRRREGGRGRTLVICCEGNAGFYEMGMLTTPLDAGYSVVGWNHPGFWGSTGSPTPAQDAAAADAVMQMAVQRLGFEFSSVVVYGWSIGGFSASWLGMNYPKVAGLVLDATFDHLTPLAVPRMPAFLADTVKIAVEENVNLDVAAQLARYSGPLRLIRRTRDEMISTDDASQTGSNRGNFLLEAVLRHRYPELFESSQAGEQLKALLALDGPHQGETL